MLCTDLSIGTTKTNRTLAMNTSTHSVSFVFFLKQAVQASFVAEEWVNHTFSKSREAKSKLAHSDKALAEIKRNYKDSLFHLTEAERGRKSAKLPWEGLKSKPRRCGSH